MTIRGAFAFAFIDRKTDRAKRWIARTIGHKAFRTMSVHNKKIAKTFKSPFTSVTCYKVVPFTFARTRAKISFTRKTPSRCDQYRTVAFKTTETLCTRKRIGSRRGRSKWIHLVTYGNHRLYLKKDTNHLYHTYMYLFLSECLVDIIVQIICVQHIIKGDSKQVHDVILIVERCNPFANVVYLV